jgi:hypothetical protein
MTALRFDGMLVTMADAAGLPERDVAIVEQWCREQIPEDLADELRVECDVTARHITLLECRPPWRENFGPEWTRFPVARLRYTKSRLEWSLYWRDRHLQFHLYDRVKPTRNIRRLLAEVERDPTAIFWG